MVKLPTRQTSLREAVLWVISQLAAGSPKSIEAYVNDLTLKHGEDARFWALDLAERYWRGLQHDKKVADWECRKILGTPAERDNAYEHPSLSMTPDMGNLPWQVRRPSIEKKLCGTIVSHKSGLVFGATRIPTLRSIGDDGLADGQAWVDTLLRVTAWWSRCYEARNLGGGIGSVALGPQIVELPPGRDPLLDTDPQSAPKGKPTPILQVQNTKFCRPKWKGDRALQVLEALEIRYRFTRQVLENVPRVGSFGVDQVVRPKEFWFWRWIDEQIDVTLEAPVDRALKDGWTVTGYTGHGLGFCPWVWIQNEPNSESDDGKADCEGQWPNFDVYDALRTDAFRAIHKNCAPTIIAKCPPGMFTKLETGIDVVMVIGNDPGTDAKYLEYTGMSAEAADKAASQLRDSILEDSRCVLEVNPKNVPRSATEVTAQTQAMFEHAEIHRTQYGPGILRAFQMMLRIVKAKGVEQALVDRDGNEVFKGKEAPKTVTMVLDWPPFIQLSPKEKTEESLGVVSEVASGLLSHATGTKILAPIRGVTDVEAELKQIAKEKQDAIEAGVDATLGQKIKGLPKVPALDNRMLGDATDGREPVGNQEGASTDEG